MLYWLCKCSNYCLWQGNNIPTLFIVNNDDLWWRTWNSWNSLAWDHRIIQNSAANRFILKILWLKKKIFRDKIIILFFLIHHNFYSLFTRLKLFLWKITPVWSIIIFFTMTQSKPRTTQIWVAIHQLRIAVLWRYSVWQLLSYINASAFFMWSFCFSTVTVSLWRDLRVSAVYLFYIIWRVYILVSCE